MSAKKHKILNLLSEDDETRLFSISREGYEKFLKVIAKPAKPTQALIDLMAGKITKDDYPK